MPSSNDNFRDCAERHFNDSEFLLRNSRHDNAVYLAGFAVECALKFAVVHYQSRGLRDPLSYRHRVGDIASELISALSLLPHSSASIVLQQIKSPNVTGHPLHGHPSRRYWSSGVWSWQEAVDAVDLAREAYRKVVIPIQTLGRLF